MKVDSKIRPVEFILKIVKSCSNCKYICSKKYNKKERYLKLLTVRASVTNNQQQSGTQRVAGVGGGGIEKMSSTYTDNEFYSLKLLHQETCNFQNEQLL